MALFGDRKRELIKYTRSLLIKKGKMFCENETQKRQDRTRAWHGYLTVMSWAINGIGDV